MARDQWLSGLITAGSKLNAEDVKLAARLVETFISPSEVCKSAVPCARRSITTTDFRSRSTSAQDDIASQCPISASAELGSVLFATTPQRSGARVYDLRRTVRILAAVVSVCTQAITASKAQTTPAVSDVSCDDFKKRLANAAMVLEFGIPAPNFQGVPTAGSDYWWISYSRQSIEANMSCRNGMFQEFELYDYSVHAPISAVSHPQTYQLLAASLYAYTGWQPREVLKGVTDLLKTAKDEGIPGTARLSNGAVAHLWINTHTSGTAHLTIELAGDESK
jgi:hypothetical protein